MAKELQRAVLNYVRNTEHAHRKKVQYIPRCFTEKQYKSWLIAENEFHTTPVRGFICRDCSTEYQKRMQSEGKCFNCNVNLQAIID